MNNEAKSNLIVAIILAGCTTLSFVLHKTFFGIAGAAITIWFLVMFFTSFKK